MNRPNILFILTDQHATNTIGAYGSKICKTPNIDAIASEGVTFDNAYASCPICTPARASIQTGLYPFKHGMQTNIYTRGCMIHELPDDPMLLSRRLQKQGYQTGYTGKWHLGMGDNPKECLEFVRHTEQLPLLKNVQGIKGSVPSTVGYYGDDFPGHGGTGDEFLQYRQYLNRKGLTLTRKLIHETYPAAYEITSGVESGVSHFITSNAMEHIDVLSGDGQPFFYMLNYWGPHEPYNVPTEFVDIYRHVEIPEWKSFHEDQGEKPRIHNAQRFIKQKSWEQFQVLLRMYYARVTYIDSQIGRMISYLKAKNLYENTIIIFSADHGESLGIHEGLTDKSFFMYEDICKIPLIMKSETSTSDGKREDRFVGTCDLYSTILELSGVPRQETFRDGNSLVPLLQKEAVIWRDCIVTESSGLDNMLYTQRMLRYKDLKYVFNVGAQDELYNLAADPDEMQNLANSSEHQAVLLSMRKRLAQWMMEHHDGLLERYERVLNIKLT